MMHYHIVFEKPVINRFTTFTVKIKNNNEPGDNKRQ